MNKYKKEICDSLNSVCNNNVKYSCLQCYDENSQSYISSECKASCDNDKVRYSYCFKLNEELVLNVIVEKGDRVLIVTFYPFPHSNIRTLRKKCDNLINSY
ncbi:hypothetical protein YN1HA_28420 [Sulfurisphaera ohwakuensis]